jgi:CDP-diglyceride synthetase
MAKRAALFIALIAVSLVALLAGKVALLLVSIGIDVAAAGELYRLLRARGVQPSALAGLAGIVGLLLVAYVRGDRAPGAFPAVVAGALGVAFLVQLARRQRRDVTRAVAYTLLPVVTVGLLGAYVIALRSARNGFRLAWVFVLMAFMSEIGAIALARVRRRDVPQQLQIWERYAGAMIGTLVAAVVAAVAASPPFTWARSIVLAILVAASAATGDLVWSMVEHDLIRPEPGIKRAPASVLRAIDGVLLSAPVFFYAFRVLAS